VTDFEILGLHISEMVEATDLKFGTYVSVCGTTLRTTNYPIGGVVSLRGWFWNFYASHLWNG